MLPAIYNNTGHLAPTNRLATLFGRFLDDDPFFGPMTAGPAWSALPWSMWEDDQNVYAEVDAPGVSDKDVDVSIHDGHLIVCGERRSERTGGGYDSRTYGRFEQRLALPCPVDADRVEAKLSNGVLSLTLPKSEDAKPRKIAVKSE